MLRLLRIVALAVGAWSLPILASAQIAFNAAAGGNNGSASGTTYDFSGLTVGSGTNRVLTVGVTGSSTPSDVTGVVWDQGGTNQALTQIGSQQAGGGGLRYLSFWYVVAPTSGNKTLRVTRTTSGADLLMVATSSYTGVDQVSPIDSHADHATTATPQTETTTVVTSNCWLVTVISDTSGSPAAGASTTKRADDGVSGVGVTGIFDSNGTVGTGSQSLHTTSAASAAWNIASLKPAAGGGGGVSMPCQLLLGVPCVSEPRAGIEQPEGAHYVDQQTQRDLQHGGRIPR